MLFVLSKVDMKIPRLSITHLLLLTIVFTSEANKRNDIIKTTPGKSQIRWGPPTRQEINRPRRFLDYRSPPSSTPYYKSNPPPTYSPQYGYNDQYFNYNRAPFYPHTPYMYPPQPTVPSYYVPRSPPSMYNVPVISNRDYSPYPYYPDHYVPPPPPSNYYNPPVYPMPMPNYPPHSSNYVPPNYNYPPHTNYGANSFSNGHYESDPSYLSQSYQDQQDSSLVIEEAEFPPKKSSQMSNEEINGNKNWNNGKKSERENRDKV